MDYYFVVLQVDGYETKKFHHDPVKAESSVNLINYIKQLIKDDIYKFYKEYRVDNFLGMAKCRNQEFKFLFKNGKVNIEYIGPSKDAWKHLNEERGCPM